MQLNSSSIRTSYLKPSRSRQVALAGVFCLIASSVTTGSIGAQVRPNPPATGQVTANRAPASQRSTDTIPLEYRPPAGMCRVWVEGVPAAQQPAPTDCSTATLKKPANARVIFSDDPKGKNPKSTDRVPVKGFAPPPVKRSPVNAAIPPQAAIDTRLRDPLDSRRISDEQLFGDRPANSPASSYQGAPVPLGQSGAMNGAPMSGNGILGDPRYFTGNNAIKPPGYGSGACLDRDQDGWCDDSRFGPPACLDQDKDGRCDDLPEFASLAYPQTLPRMRSALDVVEGRGSVEVARWLGTNEFTVRLPDQGSGSTPWRAIFLDAKNELMQVWTDRNRDGMAERVEIFRNGQRVKLIQR